MAHRSFIALLSVFLLAPTTEAAFKTIKGQTMGTTYSVVYQSSPGPRITVETVKRRLERTLRSVNQEMSQWIPDSDISKFNKAPANKNVSIKPDFVKVLRFSLDLAKKTGGVFDPTVGPLLAYHGFGPKPSKKRPLKEIQKSIGYQKVVLKKNRLSKKVEKLELDLSATAKGFGVDKLFETMKSLGYTNYLVEIGGELRGTAFKRGKQRWNVGIEPPAVVRGRITMTLPLANHGIATSGNYRNFREEKNGKRIGHIFNPKLMKPLTTHVGSVSVIADTCLEADGLATALLAMGDDKGLAYAKKNNIKALFMVLKNNQFKLHRTPAMLEYDKKYRGKP